MNTKEAIEWAKDMFYMSDTSEKDNIVFITQANKVIDLLKRGGKYEKMWEEFGEEFKGIAVYGTGIFIKKGMDRYEQKYFPEKINLTFSCECDIIEE